MVFVCAGQLRVGVCNLTLNVVDIPSITSLKKIKFSFKQQSNAISHAHLLGLCAGFCLA